MHYECCTGDMNDNMNKFGRTPAWKGGERWYRVGCVSMPITEGVNMHPMMHTLLGK